MDKLKATISYLKKHEFLAVTTLWLAAIIVILLGFGTYGLISRAVVQGDGQQLPDNTVQVDLSGTCAVDFKDEAFGKAVATALKIDYSKLTQADMLKVKTLTISGKNGIESLEDLVFFPALTQLTLTNNAITSLEGVAAAPELRVLKLSKNKITDASALTSLTKLETLDLSSNPLQELPPLATLKKLKTLNLDYTKITESDFLKDSTVQTLRIGNTKLKDLDVLRYCQKLQTLYLYGYKDMDLTSLQEVETFHSIYLSEQFDRSRIAFMVGNFKNADKYTKVYLALENRGIDANE